MELIFFRPVTSVQSRSWLGQAPGSWIRAPDFVTHKAGAIVIDVWFLP